MEQLYAFVDNPSDPNINFKLGLEYEKKGQTASAASFYLRAAEKTNNIILQYISLIRKALCFEKQGNRNLTVRTLLQRAIGIMPTRPEAYYFLSRLCEREEKYHEGYMIASIGLTYSDKTGIEYINEYSGEYNLLFEKGVCAWWVGLTEESKQIMFDLIYNYKLDAAHRMAVENNIKNLGLPNHKFIYNKSLYNEIKYKFNGLEKIENNYSQVYQDLFVLTVLDGKKEGFYLEIGSNDPFYNNNTALLETIFEWSGISVEIDSKYIDGFKQKRKNKIICEDALKINYNELLKDIEELDYLQVDCDPPNISFEVLKKIISTGKIFKVITFEHDYYNDNSIKEPSREFLINNGYKLLVNDVAFNKHNSFEDWWIHESLKTKKIFRNLKEINFVEELFFEGLNKC